MKGCSEALRRIFGKHKIRCTFYSSETLRKSLSHPKDSVDKDKQNNIVYQIPVKIVTLPTSVKQRDRYRNARKSMFVLPKTVIRKRMSLRTIAGR